MMSLIAYVFPKLQTVKCVLMEMSKESRFSTPQFSQHVKESQTLGKSAGQQFYQLCSSLWQNFSRKKSFLVISEMLRPFVNTLTPDKKYFPGNRENLRQPIQMKLSKKLKIFCQFYTAFPKFTFNFKHFEKKDESHSICLSEIIVGTEV